MNKIVPDDWMIRELHEICNGISVGHVGSTAEHYTDSSGIKFIRTGDLKNGKITFSDTKYITKEFHQQLFKSKLSAGDILVSRVGDTGQAALVPEGVGEVNCANIIIIKPSQEVCPDFLLLTINSADFFSQTASVSIGSAQSVLNVGIIKKLKTRIPPLPEQKKIAEILSGIDKAKDLLAKSIEAKENLRSALLTELIDDRASNLKIDLVAKRVSGHTPSKSNPNFWDGGIPWISLTDTSKLDDRYIFDTAKEISEEGIANSSAVLHPPGVVVISRDARVGCSAITSHRMAMSQHFVGWICSDQLFNKYLYYLLQKWKPKFEAIAMGSTIPTIGVPFFRDLEIPVPDIRKQIQIAEMMESVDIEIAALRAKIRVIQNQKSGISADLLSGRKRVSI